MLIGFSAFSLVNTKPKKQLNDKRQIRKRNLWCLILFLGLFLIMALRHPSMGVDLQYGSSQGYLGRFQFIAKQSWSYLWTHDIVAYEKGYVFFNKLIGFISNGEQWYLTVCAFISLLPIFIIYNKYSDNLPHSIIIYLALTCYSAVFSAMRQAIAIGICFISFIFIKNKKIIPFILLVLLAFTFHSSAIVFLIAYLVYWIRIPKNLRIGTLVLIGIVFLFRAPLFDFFARFIKENATMDNNGALTLFLALVLVYTFSFIFGEDDKETSGLLNIFFIAIICQLFGNVHSYAARLGYYFMPFVGLLIPKVCKTMKFEPRTKSVVAIVITTAFIAFGLFTLYSGEYSWTRSYPWIPFWQNI